MSVPNGFGRLVRKLFASAALWLLVFSNATAASYFDFSITNPTASEVWLTGRLYTNTLSTSGGTFNSSNSSVEILSYVNSTQTGGKPSTPIALSPSVTGANFTGVYTFANGVYTISSLSFNFVVSSTTYVVTGSATKYDYGPSGGSLLTSNGRLRVGSGGAATESFTASAVTETTAVPEIDGKLLPQVLLLLTGLFFLFRGTFGRQTAGQAILEGRRLCAA